jgi:GDPmannose 4,6-dehydratase
LLVVKLDALLLEIDPKFFRPSEVDSIQADAAKAKKRLNWSPRISFEELVYIMMDNELSLNGCRPPGRGFDCLLEKNFNWISSGII